jgi:hypothetical protein
MLSKKIYKNIEYNKFNVTGIVATRFAQDVSLYCFIVSELAKQKNINNKLKLDQCI